jgi:hypothetical protein
VDGPVSSLGSVLEFVADVGEMDGAGGIECFLEYPDGVVEMVPAGQDSWDRYAAQWPSARPLARRQPR